MLQIHLERFWITAKAANGMLLLANPMDKARGLLYGGLPQNDTFDPIYI